MNTRTAFSIVAALAAAAFTATSAQADLVPIGPFTGELTEDWESFPLPSGEEDYLPDPSDIMGGGATISNPFMWVYTPTTGFSLGSSGWASVADGEKAMGLGGASQTAVITFAEPVLRFGAYWGAFTGSGLGDPAEIGIDFLNEEDELIESTMVEYSRSEYDDGLLEWHGWVSTVPIQKIIYSEDGVAIDGLQASFIPEPSSLVLLVLGTTLFLQSRPR